MIPLISFGSKLKREVFALAGKSIDMAIELKTNEEATKQVLIVPLLKLLGYSIHNPKEVKCEFDAYNERKGNKVDYALFTKKGDSIFVECKSMGTSLNRYWFQLEKYFKSNKDVRFAVLTNGIEYRFYSDSKERNILDKEPFFTFNIRMFDKRDIYFLKLFRRTKFNGRKLINTIRKNEGKTNCNKSYGAGESDGFKYSCASKINIDTDKLGRIIYNDELDMRIFVPHRKEYEKHMKKTDDNLLKGNAYSRYFIAAFLEGKRDSNSKGNSIVGYVIGEFVGKDGRDIATYIVNSEEIDKFLHKNKEAAKDGFINAKLIERIDRDSKVKYFRSSISVSAYNIDGLVQRSPF